MSSKESLPELKEADFDEEELESFSSRLSTYDKGMETMRSITSDPMLTTAEEYDSAEEDDEVKEVVLEQPPKYDPAKERTPSKAASPSDSVKTALDESPITYTFRALPDEPADVVCKAAFRALRDLEDLRLISIGESEVIDGQFTVKLYKHFKIQGSVSEHTNVEPIAVATGWAELDHKTPMPSPGTRELIYQDLIDQMPSPTMLKGPDGLPINLSWKDLMSNPENNLRQIISSIGTDAFFKLSLEQKIFKLLDLEQMAVDVLDLMSVEYM